MNQALMRQEITHNEGRGSGKALMLLFVVLGFGFVALLSTHNLEEPSINMPSLPTRITQSMQPSKAWQALRASRAGPFVQPVSALADKSAHSMHPVTNVESQLESQLQASSVLGRRDMIRKFAAAFAVAAAANNRAEAEDEKFDKVFGKGEYRQESDLQKAEDFTSYNKVQYKAGPRAAAPAKAPPKPGDVEEQPFLVPAVAAFAALATAAVPALLSPGQTAFEAQRTASGKPSKLGAKVGQAPAKKRFR